MLFFELEVIYFCPGDYYTNIVNISIKINKPILENNLDNTSLQNCFSSLTDKLGQRRHKNDKLTDWTQVNRCKVINFNKSTYLHLQNIPSNQLNRFLKIRVCFSNLFLFISATTALSRQSKVVALYIYEDKIFIAVKHIIQAHKNS